MYHLLVKYNGWATNRDSMVRGRVFEYTEDEIIDQFEPSGKLDAAAISRLPALFVSESGGGGSQVARVGYISKARVIGKEVHIQYSLDAEIPPIANETLEGLASDLDIRNFEFSRTHWAIKDADLFRVLIRHSASPSIAPKVFDLAEPGAADKKLVSVMMPFDASLKSVYSSLGKLAKSLGMKCLRADDIWDHDAVIQDIVSLIGRSRVLICDCTGRNPNVFYEIGIAHTMGKDVVLITQSRDDIPFDVKHLRHIVYANNAEGRRKLVAKVKERIATIIG